MKIPFLLTSLLFTYQLIAQDVVIVDRQSQKSIRQSKPLSENFYVIKFSPLQIIMGEINLGFEHEVNDMSSLEYEIGPTFSNLGFSVNSSHTGNQMPGSAPSNYETRLGFFTSVGYRFYPLDNARALNKMYISPVVKFRLYNSTIVDPNGFLGDTKGDESQMLFTFNVGYQFWIAKKFALDVFGGIGLAYESHHEKYMKYEYDPNTQLYNYSWANDNYSGARFAATLGVKLGIGGEKKD